MKGNTGNSYLVGLLANRNLQFWLLNTAGWLGFVAVTLFSYTVPYGQGALPYLIHPFIQSLIGLCLTLIMRSLFRSCWQEKAALKMALAISSVIFFSILWTVLRLLTFIMITGEAKDFTPELFMWYYPGLLIFTCWAALYHGIKYAQMLGVEHASLLEAQAKSREEHIRRLQAEANARDAQLRMLRYQLNPHFLFNTLNSITSLVNSSQNKMAAEMIVQLSQFLRYSLDSAPVELVTVAREMEALGQYLNIEKTRFADRLQISLNQEEGVGMLQIPGLIVQPLVENAIKYAIAPSEQGGTIEVRAYLERGRLCITVWDDGPGLDEQESIAGKANGRGIGLSNIRERLNVLYADDFTFSLENPEQGGMLACLNLPANEVSAVALNTAEIEKSA